MNKYYLKFDTRESMEAVCELLGWKHSVEYDEEMTEFYAWFNLDQNNVGTIDIIGEMWVEPVLADEFNEDEIGVENIPWDEQTDLQRYIREQRQGDYWTINENNFYQYQIGLLDEEIWAKESQYTQMQWDHCHLRHVFEGQVFMSSYENYVRSLPDGCQNLDDSYDGIIPRFE